LPSPIRQLSVLLRQSYWGICYLQRAARPLDERPATIVSHEKAFKCFHKWFEEQALQPLVAIEFDTFVVRYTREANLSRAYFEMLISAV